MSELILKTEIKREPKCLYFCGTSPDGFIEVRRATGKPGRKFKDEAKQKAKDENKNPINGSDSL